MKYTRMDQTVVISLENGDEIHQSIQGICLREHIRLGTITGFGGVSYAKLGIWNNETAAYDYFVAEDRSMEFSNLQGNITCLDGRPFTHIHATICNNRFQTFGGHLVSGIVQNLAEMFIRIDPGEVRRVKSGPWYVMDL